EILQLCQQGAEGSVRTSLASAVEAVRWRWPPRWCCLEPKKVSQRGHDEGEQRERSPPRRILSTALMPDGRGVRARTSGKTCSRDRRGGNGPHDDDIREPVR